MNFYIADVSSIFIPEALDVRRNVRKSVRRGNPADLKRYDYRGIFYDVFNFKDKIILAGPPLYNLAKELRSAEFLIDGVPALQEPVLEDIRRTQRSHLWTQRPAKILELHSDIVRSAVRVNGADTDTFKGRRVLMTLSKNNDLHWISDWARYYVKEHEVDAVLIYDNASDRYRLRDILAELRQVDGLAAAVVVHWPYFYGPQTRGIGPFGNFCQATMLEHARRRFLSEAAGVINADIDELAVTQDGRSVFEHVGDSALGGILFAGRWIEATELPADRTPRHSDYDLFNPDTDACATKWALIPSRIEEKCAWRTHWIQDLQLPTSPAVQFRHLKGINTNWQFDRSRVVKYDPARHVRDEPLRAALDRAFGERDERLPQELAMSDAV
ncbi:hypothetical protein [Hansschlegelia plantiphila]|uniref:Glycosyltransferase family 92 protein n=1 Tax=Hansschlegelia plantiphila TaxID=374655 RepID=A0A9W6J0H6_9HYPH|nr:hypothetical protein [Hansschlegelia plantiphila]GLK68092.1 hypothetical protein GCM10008179_17300 [Hansschlegelia plantiphila]